MLMKTKGARMAILVNPTIFMKTKDLISKNHDMYEKKGTYRIFEGLEGNDVLLIRNDGPNSCGSRAVNKRN